MREVWENIKEFMKRDWTPAEKALMIICAVLLGVVYGFLIAPIKAGISCGNNNGNSYVQSDDGYWLGDEE
ncbi:hypothetical protein ACQRBN_00290 [Bariatricus sp. SGI.154]|uniref:hypothetical protein n=1 Tax=Bariatricus sp. SGI.154 TaxID=3420549 RepID=UPI003D080130